MKNIFVKSIIYTFVFCSATACKKDFLELNPIGTKLESNFYKTEKEVFEGIVAVYDVLQWGGTNGWTMKLGLLDAASDDCLAGGSDASDQPSWVAWDKFTLDPNLGPQRGLWNKNYTGIYRANLILEKMQASDISGLTDTKKARYIAEVKFLRAYFYFDLLRFFGNIPLIINTLGADQIYKQTQTTPDKIYAQIEKDLNEAIAETNLPQTVVPDELGRVTKGAAQAMLGKVILFQNNTTRMGEAATLFEDVITSGIYLLEANYGDIFKPTNKFGVESVFEVVHSNVQRGGWENFINGTEGNYNVQFFGMRDFNGSTYANGWGFCPVTDSLVNFMRTDPRFQHTVIDGKSLKSQGANYAAGYQNTDYFIKKYTPLQSTKAVVGEPALNWGYNIKEIRFADVLLMAAESFARAGNDAKAKTYLNRVRSRVGLQATNSAGTALLDDIYKERRLEFATEGLRFWDLVRTNRAASALGNQGFLQNKNEFLPIPQQEIDITQGLIKQNNGY